MATQHNRDKYPEIWAAFTKAKDAKAALMAERKVHTDAIKKLQIELEAVKSKQVELAALANKDMDKLRELSTEISRMAKAMGAKSIAAPLS